MYVCKKWHTPQGNGFVSFDYIIFQTLGAIVCFLSQLFILSSLLKPYLPFLKEDIRYNLPTTRDEICKFDVTFTVKETIKQKPELLFGPVQVKKRSTKGRGNPCKGKKKNKKKCKKGKKRQPPKPPPRPKILVVLFRNDDQIWEVKGEKRTSEYRRKINGLKASKN